MLYNKQFLNIQKTGHKMTFDKYTCEASDPELRRLYIGASDAAAIMGVSPWDTKKTLWETKMGLRPPKEMTYAMQRGIEAEPKARAWLEKETKFFFAPCRIFHEKYPWMMASMDGMTKLGKYSVEIKCPGQMDHLDARAGRVPPKYYPQLQHQMLVTGHKSMYYLSWVETDPILILVEADEEYQKNLLAEEEKFYQSMIEFAEPEANEKDVVQKHNASWIDNAVKLKYLLEYKENVEEQIEDIRNQLIEEADGQTCQGGGIKLTLIKKKGSIDYAKIPELGQIDLEKYRKPETTSWRLTQCD